MISLSGAKIGAFSGDETLNAQSSGLADRSSGRPKLKTPNGLGSEFAFGAPREFPSGDEDAIASLTPVEPKLPPLSAR